MTKTDRIIAELAARARRMLGIGPLYSEPAPKPENVAIYTALSVGFGAARGLRAH